MLLIIFLIADHHRPKVLKTMENHLNHCILHSETVVSTAALQQEACEFVSGAATVEIVLVVPLLY